MNPISSITAARIRFASKRSFVASFVIVANACFTSPAPGAFLYSLPGTPLPGGLVSYTIGARSLTGERLNGIADPEITPLGGAGLHQVWLPITDSPTPTRQEHFSPLWSEAWRSYDSFWFFENVNSLSVGGAFTETNNHVGGAVLPSAGFGAPATGFGSMSSNQPARKFYTLSHDFPGPDIPLAQLVLKDREFVQVDLSIVTADGVAQVVDPPFIVGGCCTPLFEVHDLFFGGVPRDIPFTAGPLPTNATIADIDWSLVSLVGPDGAVTGASVDPLTGVFSWQNAPTDPGGHYVATIQGTNAGEPAGTDSGLLTFILPPVPEPASVTLLGLVTFGLVGFVRRR